ncbi:hypothetical protein OHC33_007438 [Knufia fluminis]|uniref:DUF7730 domain-containing protein n=1 Tax=Knufia fluminis TaxID=191047 RepID=A0AAN8IKP2_9EURO|nr:hypothetical protein OHC33_007438 [Knufia fluminis]
MMVQEAKLCEMAKTINQQDLLASHLYPSPDIEKISKQNSVKPPLLRLPPEIRQKIYEFAISGQWIHVNDFSATRKWFSVLYLEQDLLSEGDSWVHKQPEKLVWRPGCNYHEVKVNCVIRKTNTVPTHLARVCRLFHQEASLLPYRGSIFSFADNRIATSFIQSLKPCQQQSITKVALNHRFGMKSSNAAVAKLLPDFTQSYVLVSVRAQTSSLGVRLSDMGRLGQWAAQKNHKVNSESSICLEGWHKHEGGEVGTWYGFQRVRASDAGSTTVTRFLMDKRPPDHRDISILRKENEALADEANAIQPIQLA